MKGNIFSRKNFRLIVLVSFIVILSIFTIGYASFASVAKIEGSVVIAKYTGRLRILSISLNSIDGNSSELHTPTFYSTTSSFGIKMDELSSKVTYKIIMKNESNTDKMFRGINESVYDNYDIEYKVSGILEGQVLSPGEQIEVFITFNYVDGLKMVPNNSQLGAVLLFNFSDDSFKKLEGTIDTVVADFSTGTTYGTFNVTVTNPNDAPVNFSLVLGNTQLLLYDEKGSREKITDTLAANGTKSYKIFISEKDNTISDSLTITTALNIVTNSPENTISTVTDMITIRLPNKAKYVILDDNDIVTNDPVFSNLHTDSGLFKSEDGMEGGIIYFYRGAVNNNYVKYAGYYWRILQLDDYMNVRLILDDDIGVTTGWQSSETINDLGDSLNKIDYDNSLVKPILEEWYNKNIANNEVYLSLIRDSKFCLDKSYSIMTSSGSYNQVYYFGSYVRVGLDAGNYAPIFSCPEEYLRTYKIGIIGADEISFAGGYFNAINSNFYLKSRNVTIDTWSISPSYWDPALGAGMFILEATGKLSDWTNHYTLTTARGIRPVITLDGSLIISGDGTYNNPYIFEDATTAKSG